MRWTIRSAIAAGLWVAAGLLTLLLIFSGAWIYMPFVFAGGGGEEFLILILAIAVLVTAAYLIGGRARSTR